MKKILAITALCSFVFLNSPIFASCCFGSNMLKDEEINQDITSKKVKTQQDKKIVQSSKTEEYESKENGTEIAPLLRITEDPFDGKVFQILNLLTRGFLETDGNAAYTSPFSTSSSASNYWKLHLSGDSKYKIESVIVSHRTQKSIVLGETAMAPFDSEDEGHLWFIAAQEEYRKKGHSLFNIMNAKNRNLLESDVDLGPQTIQVTRGKDMLGKGNIRQTWLLLPVFGWADVWPPR